MTTSKYKTLDYLTTDEIHRLIRYFNKMGNLIQESLIFVITDMETGDEYNDEISQIDNKNIDDVDISTKTLIKSGIDSFESTDALLLETDYVELATLYSALQLEYDSYKSIAHPAFLNKQKIRVG